jgi:GNAT superfamily N-acetyltransferase
MEIIFKIAKNSKEMKLGYPLIDKHYQDFSEEKFLESVEEMISLSNYQMLLVFVKNQEKSTLIDKLDLVGVCGFWFARMFYCGKYLQLSNFMVDESLRGSGVGKKVLNYFENFARQNNCQKIVLDSYTENKKSHSLYFHEGFYIRGFHFMKDLDLS